MKQDKRYAGDYPEIIQAEAAGGVIVEYIRVDSARTREFALICATYNIGNLDHSTEAELAMAAYKEAKLEELK